MVCNVPVLQIEWAWEDDVNRLYKELDGVWIFQRSFHVTSHSIACSHLVQTPCCLIAIALAILSSCSNLLLGQLSSLPSLSYVQPGNFQAPKSSSSPGNSSNQHLMPQEFLGSFHCRLCSPLSSRSYCHSCLGKIFGTAAFLLFSRP